MPSLLNKIDSTNGKLVVWGPVVWDSNRVPLSQLESRPPISHSLIGQAGLASWVSKVSLGFIDETDGGLGGFLVGLTKSRGHFGRILRDHWGFLGGSKAWICLVGDFLRIGLPWDENHQ